MEEFNDISDVAQHLVTKGKKVNLLYGFNGMGKTRLSMAFKELVNSEDTKKVLYFNAYTEDLFSWDNDLDNDNNKVLKMNVNSIFLVLIRDQGLEGEITKKFQNYSASKLEPNFNFNTGEIIFTIPLGTKTIRNIKISKGEESVFIWSMFYSLVESVIDIQSDDDNQLFDAYNYIYIDDPVSSLDDNHIIDVALDLKRLFAKTDLKIIISTHHALFFNVLYNEYSKAYKCILTSRENKYYLEQTGDSPFGYHLLLKNEIMRAIINEDIKKFHFQLFRNILEKTANFLGYKKWSDCLTGHFVTDENRDEYARIINLYSHDSYSDLGSNMIPQQEKEMLKTLFNSFINEYKWFTGDNNEI